MPCWCLTILPTPCRCLQPESESDEEEEDEENKEDGVVDRDYIKLRAAKMSHRLAQRK